MPPVKGYLNHWTDIDPMSLAVSALLDIPVPASVLQPATPAKPSSLPDSFSVYTSLGLYMVDEKILRRLVPHDILFVLLVVHSWAEHYNSKALLRFQLQLPCPKILYINKSSTSFGFTSGNPSGLYAALFISSVYISWSSMPCSKVSPMWYSFTCSSDIYVIRRTELNITSASFPYLLPFLFRSSSFCIATEHSMQTVFRR